MYDFGLIAGGLLLLFLGGEGLVRGAVSVAQRHGLSPLVIGLTIVAAGTSAPELVVSLQAAGRGEPDIVLGNVVGSNIANLLLILGASAVIRPLTSPRAAIFRDGGVLAAATLAVLAVAQTGTVARWHGIAMVAGLCAYLLYTYRSARGSAGDGSFYAEEVEEFAAPLSPWMAWGFIGGGLGVLLIGSDWLVEGAVSLAVAAGVPQAVIGLTLVAVGTSLPELATSLVAALRGHAGVAVGNAVGSSIFNFLGILGLTAAVTPLSVAPRIAAFDLWILLGVMLLSLPVMVSGWRISRAEGAVFLAIYGGYAGWLYAT